MGKNLRMLRGVGVLLLLFSIPSCEKPKLRTDTSKESEEALKKAVGEDSGDRYQKIRKGVIGRTFETLTLGSRQFANAEVRDITDKAIVIGHAGGVDKVPWSEVPVEVRERWGYNPSTESKASRLTNFLSGKNRSSEQEGTKTTKPSEESATREPKMDSRQRAMEIARRQKMLEAQMVGIRSLESDLARHSERLNELRSQLLSIRARQSGQRSNRILVERVGGKSHRVDREREARELESKIKVQEPLVAQLSQSLQAAREQYQEMKRALDQFWRE
ncbi:MAG: hypothetical protein WD342_09165 [Verrucomicrobiales bacterium]